MVDIKKSNGYGILSLAFLAGFIALSVDNQKKLKKMDSLEADRTLELCDIKKTPNKDLCEQIGGKFTGKLNSVGVEKIKAEKKEIEDSRYAGWALICFILSCVMFGMFLNAYSKGN